MPSAPHILTIDGRQIDSEKALVAALAHSLSIPNRFKGIFSRMEKYFKSQEGHFKIIWLNSGASHDLEVRKSDVPPDQLPKGGSPMQRDIILDLLCEQQNLHEKVQGIINEWDNVEVEFR